MKINVPPEKPNPAPKSSVVQNPAPTPSVVQNPAKQIQPNVKQQRPN